MTIGGPIASKHGPTELGDNITCWSRKKIASNHHTQSPSRLPVCRSIAPRKGRNPKQGKIYWQAIPGTWENFQVVLQGKGQKSLGESYKLPKKFEQAYDRFRKDLQKFWVASRRPFCYSKFLHDLTKFFMVLLNFLWQFLGCPQGFLLLTLYNYLVVYQVSGIDTQCIFPLFRSPTFLSIDRSTHW